MPGTFDKYTATVQAISDYPHKMAETLQLLLSQEQIDAVESAMTPTLSQMQKAQKIYTMGNIVKEIGVAECAAAFGLPEEALTAALVNGTAAADALAAAPAEEGASNGDPQ